ncbi:hypothetical protein AgCh_004601 [Apium graveolens]
MADKSASSRHEQAISELKLSFEDSKTRVASIEASVSKLVEENQGLRKDFQDLMEILKTNPPPKVIGGGLEAEEGSSSQTIVKSKEQGMNKTLAHTPTRFGTIKDAMVLDITS